MIPGIQVNGANGSGDSQPPRNRTVVIDDIVSTATSSVRNCSRKSEAEYSTE